jgi:hypothetical protein
MSQEQNIKKIRQIINKNIYPDRMFKINSHNLGSETAHPNSPIMTDPYKMCPPSPLSNPDNDQIE